MAEQKMPRQIISETSTTNKARWIGMCDKIRTNHDGETLWQEMMKCRVRITEREFLKNVNPSVILDRLETWKQRINHMTSEDPSTAFYKSCQDIFFIQTAGFEFIWQKKTDAPIFKL